MSKKPKHIHTLEFYHSKIEKWTHFPQKIYKLSRTNWANFSLVLREREEKNKQIFHTIAAKTEKKGYVQSSLDQRKKALEIDFQSDNVDSSGDQENSGKFGEDEAYT